MSYNSIHTEVARVFAETGECPRVIFISVNDYRLWLIDGGRYRHFPAFGEQKLCFISAYGEIEVKPSEVVPDNVVWANHEDYASYWARRILMDDIR